MRTVLSDDVMDDTKLIKSGMLITTLRGTNKGLTK